MPDLLVDITMALLEDLTARYPDVQVMRNGNTQLTLFRPLVFEYAQVVVSENGIYMIVNHTKDTSDTVSPPVPAVEGSRLNRGPLELAEPSLFCTLYQVIESWLTQP